MMKNNKHYGTETTVGLDGVIPGKPRYDPNSPFIEAEIVEWAKRVGPLRRRERWTRPELRMACAGFTFFQWNLVEVDLKIRSFLTVLRRTRNSVNTMLRKTSMRHPDFQSRLDFPVFINRTGSPFVGPDLYVLNHAFGPGGMEYGANNFWHIGHLLGRDVCEVAAWYYDLAKRTYQMEYPPTCLKDPPPDCMFRLPNEGTPLVCVREWIKEEIKKYKAYLNQFNLIESKEIACRRK